MKSTKSMTIMSILSLLLLQLLLIRATVSCSPTNERYEELKVVSLTPRDGLDFRKIFNFSNFMKAFGKRYPNVVERLSRMKTYLANAMQIFSSLIKFKCHKSTSYLAINHMSDWTAEEVKRTHNKGSDGSIQHEKGQRRQLKVRAEDGVENLEAQRQSVDESSIHSENKVRFKRELNFDEAYNIARNLVLSPHGIAVTPDEETAKDNVTIDYRRGECLSSIRDQGMCGSCYAFASIALYEWLFCNQTGTLPAFSEQYVVDCGQLSGLKGCDGGSTGKVGLFIKKYGLESRSNYPYLAKQGKCPFNGTTDRHKMGLFQLSEAVLAAVEKDSVEMALNFGPLILTVATPRAFHLYGGGVDDADGCDREESHSMLLVGKGKQFGKDYWLLRNSYGPDFGEEGYYKLNRMSSNCILNGGEGTTSAVQLYLAQTGENYFYAQTNPQHEVSILMQQIADIVKFWQL